MTGDGGGGPPSHPSAPALRPHCFDLEFCADAAGRSFIGAQFVRYPLHVCRGLHTDPTLPGACSVTLQSVSGGLFESDAVSGRIRARAGVTAQVSTSASTIVHTMRGGWATQSVELEADRAALLEYMPEPLILFPASQLRSQTTVRAHPSSAVVFCESFLAHDPTSSGQTFGSLDARVCVRGAAGELMARERLCLSGDDWQRRQTGVSDRFLVHGGLWIIRPGDNAALLRVVRDALADEPVYAGASELPHHAGVLARILCADAVAWRRTRRALHQAVRRVLDVAVDPFPPPTSATLVAPTRA